MPSLQLCIENLDQAGGCDYNYGCAYTDTISWASPSEPLPMIRNPRIAFDLLFGAGLEQRGPHVATQGEPEHPRLDHGRGGRPAAPARSVRSRAARQVRHRHPRARAPHSGGRGAQRVRRSARTARGADRRSGFVRGAHEADVRHPGARAAVGHDARHLVQDGPRRVEPRVPRRAGPTRGSIRRRTTAAARRP